MISTTFDSFGSGVATTVTVASLTWPLLRRAGYDPDTETRGRFEAPWWPSLGPGG